MPTVQQATAKTKARIAAKQAEGSSTPTTAKVGDVVEGRKVLGTRKGVPTRFEGQSVDKTDGGRDPEYAQPDDEMVGAETPTTPTPPTTPTAPTPDSEGLVPYEQAVQGLNTGGLTGETLTMAQKNLANKYGKTLQSLQGTAAPSTYGEAMSSISEATPFEPDTSSVDSFLTGQPLVDGLFQQILGDLDPKTQTTTLMEDYKKLYKKSGLDEINEEMIDAETVINGTEDDIRNEIQTAGGFGTDSQIQALALSRNKNLLKRYNALAQMQTNAQRQLDTMMQLSAQDKQMAQQQMQNRISTMFNLANFAQQAQNNIKEQYRWLAQTAGFDGLYEAYAGDQRQLALLERATGIGGGMLANLAAQARIDRARQQQMLDLDARYKEAQIYDIYASRQGQAEEKLAKVAESNRQTADNARNVLVATSDALKFLGAGVLTSGVTGAVAKYIPGSSAKNLEGALKTTKANLAFDRLQEMRAASPTGGALGAVSDRELQALESAASSLDIGQSGPVLNTNIRRVQKKYLEIVQRLGYQVGKDAEGNIILNYPTQP